MSKMYVTLASSNLQLVGLLLDYGYLLCCKNKHTCTWHCVRQRIYDCALWV